MSKLSWLEMRQEKELMGISLGVAILTTHTIENVSFAHSQKPYTPPLCVASCYPIPPNSKLCCTTPDQHVPSLLHHHASKTRAESLVGHRSNFPMHSSHPITIHHIVGILGDPYKISIITRNTLR
ncbi:hypothetical protein AAZV13_03G083500 [Glycine max]